MTIKLRKSSVSRGLSKNEKLVPHLDRCIYKAGEFPWTFTYEEKVRDDAWHPSGDCTSSLHELYLKATSDQEESIDAGLRKTFMVGHFWHQYLQEILVNHLEFADETSVERRAYRGWGEKTTLVEDPIHGGKMDLLESNARWKPFHWATGSADVAPCTIPGKGEYLVDFKTMGSHDYKRNGLPTWAAAKYECQLNIYMHWFGLNRALLLAVLKDSPHHFKEFEFEYNPELAEAIVNKWKLVSACLDEGVAPPVDEPYDLPLTGLAS